MKRIVIAAFLALSSLAAAGAGEADVSIRYFDKRVYYAGAETGPIYVQVTIANHGATDFRFKLADERAFSIDFELRTPTNRVLEPNNVLIRKRTQDQPVFFREVSVAPGESFSFTENLRDYADLEESGSFIVQARVYPELFRPAGAPSGSEMRRNAFSVAPAGGQMGGSAKTAATMSAPLLSNRLTLTLRPAPLMDGETPPPQLDVETGAVLVRENLPPDRVVEYMLTARQKGQWEKFFLYMDLEAMLSRDGARKRAWLAESEEGRARMLQRYRSDLMSAVVDGDIATIPIEFVIDRTNYGNEDGTVIATEKFRFGTYTERKRYTYYLKRRDDVWTIQDYSVTNLGTE